MTAKRRARLAGRARDRGIEAIILDPGQDLAALAGEAVAAGADALGMAGGDGSLAVVAAEAAAHGIPFVCMPQDRCMPGSTARLWTWIRRCGLPAARRRCGSGSPRATRALRHQRASASRAIHPRDVGPLQAVRTRLNADPWAARDILAIESVAPWAILLDARNDD